LQTNQGTLRAVVIDYFSEPGFHRIHFIRFFIALKYCISMVVWVLQNTGIDYWQC